MTYARVRSYGGRYLVHGMAVLAAAISPICTCDAQYVTENQGPNSLLSQELSKYPDLPNELANLVSRFQENVHFPAPRTESRLLPLLPQSTVAYVAIPNYGDTASQVVGAFRQELSEDPKLRDWWAHGAAAEAGPKVVNSLQKFSELNGYLGDEIVLFATMTGKEPAFVAISEIRKPGLKKFLQDTAVQYWGTSKPAVRVFDSAELASAKEKALTGQLLILVRSDFVVASSDLQTVRKISAGFDGHSREFAATAFGRRMAQEYRDGVTIVAGADVHGIVEKASPETAQSPAFQKSGFADMQYLVWNRKTIGGKKVGQLELSFTGPRHGAAAWLAKPTALGSYNFVSPHAFMAASLVLANPVQIFGDAQELARLSGSNAFAAIPAFEQALNLSLKDDLLSLIGGEITFELGRLQPGQQPQWKAILAVKDSNHLERTLSTLLATAHIQSTATAEGGVTYHEVFVPSGRTGTEISYAFSDGYLIVGPNHHAVAETIDIHKSGEALGKSKKFFAALPPGCQAEASGLFYEDTMAGAEMNMRRLAPELAEVFSQASTIGGAITCIYADDAAIREVSASPGVDLGAILVVGAIAIPNLIRARIAANEASAAATLRTVNVAQLMYSSNYPTKGFSPDLAKLGADPHGPPFTPSAEHAGMLDETLANPACSGDGWCTKSGYEFRITGVCKQHGCSDYVVVAAPVSTSTGTRSFCSTSDAVVRYRLETPAARDVTVEECKSWLPIQ